ncbi:MAG TPA: hypothetical protein VN685_04955 [Rhizomicrobium sp.]|nr:hypothetical protein [Rhizomicrobium sp.]
MPIVNFLTGIAILASAPAAGDGHSKVPVTSHAVAVAACHRQATTANKKDIRISGVLVRRAAFGPPNYGENPKTDSRLAYWVVELDVPIKVITGLDIDVPSQTITVHEMQILRGPGLREDVDSFRGMHVVVRGVIGTQVFAQDMTPVNIVASNITAGGPIPCEG